MGSNFDWGSSFKRRVNFQNVGGRYIGGHYIMTPTKRSLFNVEKRLQTVEK